MFKMLLSVVVSLAPHRYRRRWFGDYDTDVKRGAIVSGAAQITLSAFLLWWRYPGFLASMDTLAVGTVRAHGGTDHMREAVGAFSVDFLSIFVYLTLPLTIFLMYFAVEGAVRLLAAVATGEVLPTLSLAIVERVHHLGEVRQRELVKGPRVADEIVSGTSPEYDLRIDSCRMKPWNHLTTVRYEDELYEVVKEMKGVAPRPHVYFLKKMKTGKIVRGIHEYDPVETLEKREPQLTR